MARGRGGGARPRAGRLRHVSRCRPPRLAGEGRGAGRARRPPARPRARSVRRTARPPQDTDPSATAEPVGCTDPDLQVVATCLAPVSAVAVLPDSRTALVAERTTGRVLRVQRGIDPVLVTTVPVDPSGGGGLTGLVLSPGYAEDRLVYAYATTAEDNRVLRLAPGEEPKPVLTGIPRGSRDNGGALATDGRNALLVATGLGGSAVGRRLARRQAAADRHARPARRGQPEPGVADRQLRPARPGRGLHGLRRDLDHRPPRLPGRALPGEAGRARGSVLDLAGPARRRGMRGTAGASAGGADGRTLGVRAAARRQRHVHRRAGVPSPEPVRAAVGRRDGVSAGR